MGKENMPTATTEMCHVSAIAMPYPNTDPSANLLMSYPLRLRQRQGKGARHRTHRDPVWRVADAKVRNTVIWPEAPFLGHCRFEDYRSSARGRSYGNGPLRLWPGGRGNHWRRPSKRARPWKAWPFFTSSQNKKILYIIKWYGITFRSNK